MISSIPHFPLLLGVTVALPRSVFLPGVIGNVQLFLGTKVLFSGTDSHLVYDWMITRMKLIFYLHLLNSQGRMLINPGFSKLSRVSQSLKIYKLKSFLDQKCQRLTWSPTVPPSIHLSASSLTPVWKLFSLWIFTILSILHLFWWIPHLFDLITLPSIELSL